MSITINVNTNECAPRFILLRDKKISQIQIVFDVEFEKPNFMIFEIRYFGTLNFLVKMNLVLM